MIDIEAIEEWNSHDLDGDAYEVQAIVSKGDLMDIITALRQSEKDAARYRWLRDDANYHKHSGALVFITDSNGNIDDFNGHSGVLSGMDLDHEVDEAMSDNQALIHHRR